MNKLLYFVALELLIQSFAYSNGYNPMQNNGDSINVISADGKKNGFWIEYKHNMKTEAYYKNNLLNGLSKTYYQNNIISSFGNYSKGQPIGIWYFFDEKGRLILSEESIKNINYSTKTKNGTIKYNHGSYQKYYFNSGNIKEEGFAYYDDIEENIQKDGLWKIYNENGIVVKTVAYKNGTIYQTK